MDKVLIDTDVILDFFYDRQPYSEYVSRILSLWELKQIQGFITPVICSNIYYLLRQTAEHKKVIEKLSQLLTFTDVLVMNKAILIQALRSDFKDFENALQDYSAECSGNIDAILTRNTKDFRSSKLGVMTPENYLKTRIGNL